MSLGMQTEGLQIFSKHQKQIEQGRKHEEEEEEICKKKNSIFLKKFFNFLKFQTPYLSNL
jgi:hypothetical protein